MRLKVEKPPELSWCEISAPPEELSGSEDCAPKFLSLVTFSPPLQGDSGAIKPKRAGDGPKHSPRRRFRMCPARTDIGNY